MYFLILGQGVSEQLINKLVSYKLDNIDKNEFYIQHHTLDKSAKMAVG